jgi:hypothetical protein
MQCNIVEPIVTFDTHLIVVMPKYVQKLIPDQHLL